MDNEVAYIVAGGGTIKLVLNGKQFTVTDEHLNYTRIKDSLGTLSATELGKLVDIERNVRKAVSRAATDGNTATVINGVVYYNDEPIHNTLATRILEMMQEGFPVSPMLKFLGNLMSNPSKTAVDELYDFLSAKGLPITEDGHFLAYKGVTEDFKDKYTRKISNRVGDTVEVPRNSVDDNREHQCSHGLHVGHYEYASMYAGGSPVILVKVNPADAVSVPKDHGFSKLRTCRYEVVRVFKDSSELEDSLYNNEGDTFVADEAIDDWEEDYNKHYEDAEEERIGCAACTCGSDNCSECTCGACGPLPEDDDFVNDEELSTLVSWYDEEFDRDVIVTLAVKRGLYRIKEEARTAGKAAVCLKLAQDDLS